MPIVFKDTMWVSGEKFEHLEIKVNIDSKGMYYCKLPESVARHFRREKITGQGMDGVVRETMSLCRDYKKWAESRPGLPQPKSP